MSNEVFVRGLIRGSIQRALQESVAALIVLSFFGTLLPQIADGSLRYGGCLLILVGTGFVVGVVWSHALSYRLLRSHPAGEAGFWREASAAQARLLRLVPLWYCAPLGVGTIMFVAPRGAEELSGFLMVASILAVVLTAITWINRRAAACIDQSAKLLAD